MRILRIRRGFTTNSSSANEWMGQLPSPTQPNQNDLMRDLMKPNPLVANDGMLSPTMGVGTVSMNISILSGIGVFLVLFLLAERGIKYLLRTRSANKSHE